jgi:hypothetical protein
MTAKFINSNKSKQQMFNPSIIFEFYKEWIRVKSGYGID